MLQLISLVLLIYSFFITRTTIPNLPARIPTHFNAAGVADGWGSPNVFWVMLGVQAITTVVCLAVPYIGQVVPWAVHFGRRRLSDFPEALRPRLLGIMSDMSAWMSINLNVFFILMVHELIRAIREPGTRLHPFFPLGILIGGMLGVTLLYFKKFNNAANGDDGVDLHPPNAA